MGVLDQAIVPTQVTPSSTSDTTLYTAAADTILEVSVALLDEANNSCTVRVGITPSGGSVHWKVEDFPLPPGNPAQFGPYTLRNGDAITVGVGTGDSNDAQFSCSGWRST